MSWIRSRTLARVMASLLVAGAICGTAVAQDASSQLESQLKTILKVTEVEWVGNNVVKVGTVVRLTKTNLLFATPETAPVLCPATVREGKEDIPSSMCRLMMKETGSFLQEGEKLYVTKIKVNMAKDTVALELVDAELDPNTGRPVQPKFKTAVNFVFAKGYLSKADAGQIADAINNLVPPDTDAAPIPQQVAAQQFAGQQEAAQQTQVAAPTVVELGMTEEQVKSILGLPTKANQPAGNTKIYVYHKQITFRDGKVSSID
jgi:hypothetical protein